MSSQLDDDPIVYRASGIEPFFLQTGDDPAYPLSGMVRPCATRLPVVGASGFEPPTPWSQTRCATRLRHAPVDLTGIEPVVLA